MDRVVLDVLLTESDVNLRRFAALCASLAPALLALLAAGALAACAWSVPADPGLVAECRPCKPGCAHRTPPSASPPSSTAASTRPASVGAPAAQGASPAPAQSRAEGEDEVRAIYVAHCSRCHEPFPPTHATAAQWPVFVRKYGPRAGLFGSDRDRVLAWLQSHSR